MSTNQTWADPAWTTNYPSMPISDYNKWVNIGAFPSYSKQSQEQLASTLVSQAYDQAYQNALEVIIDAVARFGACACEADHEEECAWNKGVKQIKKFLREALAAAQVEKKLK